jgi:dienelactone hydrolase
MQAAARSCMSIGAWLVCVAATAQTPAGELHAAAVDIEPVTLAITGARPGDAVSGDLRLPRGSPGRVPAVLILHSSPGYDGRGTFYAEALNRAGIATLEIDYLRGKGIPPTPRDNLPHVFQTLRHLTGHARIDPARVGVLGFSWGGILAVLASSSDLAREYGDGRQFAAHVGLYPICWQHHAIAAGRSNWFGRNIYARVTGRPVLILAGGQDAFDDPDSCQRFVAALRPQARANFSVTTYPTATFGWDSRFGSATYDSGVNKGRGGINTIVADPKVAEQSREDVVALFATALSTAPR